MKTATFRLPPRIWTATEALYRQGNSEEAGPSARFSVLACASFREAVAGGTVLGAGSDKWVSTALVLPRFRTVGTRAETDGR
jgi:hypothetical protein